MEDPSGTMRMRGEPAVEKKKKVMLRGWQYLCRPTRWRLWEGCRAGQERKNSVRRGQGFLYGGPVRNNAHARRYFSAAKGFWASDIKKKKSALVAATGCMTYCGVCLHKSLRWEKKKKRGCFESSSTSADPPDGDCGKDAEQDKRGKTPSGGGQGFLYGGPVRNNAHARRTYCGVCLHKSLRWKKKKKKVMLRGWQYLCRPTRWRLWEGCRAGQERKNSVRRGQGFLYGGPVRNNAHARRPERRHLLEANEITDMRPGRQD
ncbi:uncharacterized protein LOC133491112 [Syngnathoides biaculeatus]|uniref:uncharacterized protein LOC133491112 n=1 Tax=Syngnathoides biaculeatus TaxID=300417 RepID=UPI002ADDA0F5|nr:uncharacterized protein LOC133491112 [Syngnathoides biaculeatus]